jgi:hypothetical protein
MWLIIIQMAGGLSRYVQPLTAVETLHGMEEIVGSIPTMSTN